MTATFRSTDAISRILQSVPLFRHCSDDEIDSLKMIGRLSVIKTGQSFDLKKISSFNVVVDGIFEIEALGRTDIVYLAPGSFFGNVPFTDNRLKGTIRALADSTLLLIPLEELSRFFLLRYKCLRGYLKIADRMGFNVNEVAGRYLSRSTKIIAVCGGEKGSGKTVFSAALGLALSGNGPTIVLDISYDGDPVFDQFDKKITTPISQKSDDRESAELLIHERVEKVTDSLHLLNVAHGSKVKVKGEILPPVLFVLSREYRYIVLDVAGIDAELRDTCLGISDRIFCILKDKKEKSRFYPVLDAAVQDGQRVYYVLNDFFSKGSRGFSGGYILEKCGTTRREGGLTFITALAGTESMKTIAAKITKPYRAAVFESNYLDGLFFSGFLNAMGSRIEFDLCYSSSLSYIVVALYHLLGGGDEFKKRIITFFSEEKFGSFLDITFPAEHVFKNSAIARYAEEIAGTVRLEELQTLSAAMLVQCDTGRRVIFSSGFLKDMITASFLLYPLFEPVTIAGGAFGSGFPERVAGIEQLYRCDVDERVYVSVKNSARLGFTGDRVIPFYRNYIDSISSRELNKASELADENYVIEVSEKELKGEKIFRLTEEFANKLLKEKKII